MRPPIVVFTESEPLIFEDVDSAQGYMEPIDVVQGEYLAAYDADGIPLVIDARLHGEVERGVVPGGITELREAGMPPDPIGVAARLDRFSADQGEARVGQGNLAAALKAFVERWGYTR